MYRKEELILQIKPETYPDELSELFGVKLSKDEQANPATAEELSNGKGDDDE